MWLTFLSYVANEHNVLFSNMQLYQHVLTPTQVLHSGEEVTETSEFKQALQKVCEKLCIPYSGKFGDELILAIWRIQGEGCQFTSRYNLT